eukprot:508725_1
MADELNDKIFNFGDISFTQINEDIDSPFDVEKMPAIVRTTSMKCLFENTAVDVDENYDSDKPLDDINDQRLYIEDDEQFIKLKSGGKEPLIFEISKKCVQLSKFVATILDGRRDATQIEIHQVPSETLRYVLEYLHHHNGKEPDPLPCPVRSKHMSEMVSDQWDAIWINAFDKETIFEIIKAANYMDIKSLMNLGCAKIATFVIQPGHKHLRNQLIKGIGSKRRCTCRPAFTFNMSVDGVCFIII